MFPPTPTLRILWLESGELSTIARVVAAGHERGLEVVRRPMEAVMFAADGHSPAVTADGEDLIANYDAAVLRTFMPFISETLTVARLFALAGKVVVDRSLVDEGYAMGKMHDTLRLAAAGIAVPRTLQPPSVKEALQFADEVGYPCVIKATMGSCGKHVFKAESAAALATIFTGEPLGHWLVQEYLPAESDERVMVVGGQALPLFVRRYPAVGDFRTNFDFDRAVEAHSLADHPELKEIAEAAAKALRREFTGIDIRHRDGRPVILEANRRPGFTHFERATGLDVSGALLDHIKERCQAARDLLS